MKTHFYQTAILKYYQAFKIGHYLPSTEKKKFSATMRPGQYLRTAIGEMDSSTSTDLDPLTHFATRPLTLHSTSVTFSWIKFL